MNATLFEVYLYKSIFSQKKFKCSFCLDVNVIISSNKFEL